MTPNGWYCANQLPRLWVNRVLAKKLALVAGVPSDHPSLPPPSLKLFSLPQSYSRTNIALNKTGTPATQAIMWLTASPRISQVNSAAVDFNQDCIQTCLFLKWMHRTSKSIPPQHNYYVSVKVQILLYQMQYTAGDSPVTRQAVNRMDCS